MFKSKALFFSGVPSRAKRTVATVEKASWWRSATGVPVRIPRVFEPCSLGLGWTRSWGVRVGIAQPAISKGRANGRRSTAANAVRARHRRGRCRVEAHCPSIAAPGAGQPIKRWEAESGASVTSRPRAVQKDNRNSVKVGCAVGHHLPEKNKEAPVRLRATTQISAVPVISLI
jgi:hypothetical protein